MSDELRIEKCPIHGVDSYAVNEAEAERFGVEMGCPVHNEELRSRPDPATLTRQERAEELKALVGPLWSSWSLLHARIDALMGRSVFTHELADIDVLEYEILTGNRPSLEGIIAKFPHDKPVIVIEETTTPGAE